MADHARNNPKILLLGAGLVTRPLVQYLLNIPGFKLTIATRTASKAYALMGDSPNGMAVPFDIEREQDKLGSLVAEHDLAISLLPATYHPVVAKECIKRKKLMVTTSYVSPAMKELDAPAREKDILILNEIGLDPGIDHMSAMRVINHVKNSGGKVTSCRSYCGGLPAPEANTNPWGYKFSWSPRGVVLAARNAARYLENGRIVEIPGKDLFEHFHTLKVEGFDTPFEAYANRDSMGYVELYGLNDAKTMFRGTLRYPGHCVTWKKLSDIGLFDIDVMHGLQGMTFRGLMAKLAGLPDDKDLESGIVRKFNLPNDPPVLEKMKWLGLFEERPLPADEASPLDLLVAAFLEKLQFRPGERDMVVLHHEFIAEYPGRKDRTTSSLIDFGIPNGDTSMARTVGLPAAVAVKLILQGKIGLTGVHIPVMPEVYDPVLNELETLGIKCVERTMRI
jgi:saccharopine dehydrogenase-like NADP-dependent oxidoreductase